MTEKPELVAMSEKVVEVQKKMQKFFRTEKNMFLPIREGIVEAFLELSNLRIEMH